VELFVVQAYKVVLSMFVDVLLEFPPFAVWFTILAMKSWNVEAKYVDFITSSTKLSIDTIGGIVC
jgi:hypothetical protein